MGEERLSCLAILYIHRNIYINLDDAVECFSYIKNKLPKKLPYCYYYKRVLILVNIGDLVITAKFCARY